MIIKWKKMFLYFLYNMIDMKVILSLKEVIMKKKLLILISVLTIFLIGCHTADTINLSTTTPKFSEEDQELFTEYIVGFESFFKDYGTVTKTINETTLTVKAVITTEDFGYDSISITITKSEDIYTLTQIITVNGEEDTIYNRSNTTLNALLYSMMT